MNDDPKTNSRPRYAPEAGDMIEDMLEAVVAERDWLDAEVVRLRAALRKIEVQSTDERSRIRATTALEG